MLVICNNNVIPPIIQLNLNTHALNIYLSYMTFTTLLIIIFPD